LRIFEDRRSLDVLMSSHARQSLQHLESLA
jgi:hypothetical protein